MEQLYDGSPERELYRVNNAIERLKYLIKNPPEDTPIDYKHHVGGPLPKNFIPHTQKLIKKHKERKAYLERSIRERETI